MIQLFPPSERADRADEGPTSVTDVELAVANESRPMTEGRPWLYTNMIASADGGTAIDGLSGGLGGPGDKAVFLALRASADAILVGAATVREEAYRAPAMSDETRRRRQSDGRRADPRLAIVTRSLSLDPDLPLFDDADARPLIVTVAGAPADRRAAVEERADVVDAGIDDVDLRRALELLGQLGARTVLSEGGPSLNGQLIHGGLVDEWNLSLSPRLLAGDARRAAIGPVPDGPPPAMTLARVWSDDDFLFCRWLRQRPTEG